MQVCATFRLRRGGRAEGSARPCSVCPSPQVTPWTPCVSLPLSGYFVFILLLSMSFCQLSLSCSLMSLFFLFFSYLFSASEPFHVFLSVCLSACLLCTRLCLSSPVLSLAPLTTTPNSTRVSSSICLSLWGFTLACMLLFFYFLLPLCL